MTSLVIFMMAVYGKSSRVINEKPFLDDSHTFAFSLNVDWFQPYKHVTDSIGAVYLSILNLPRNLRYKPENIILCGILLGPKEPKDLNSYLYPLVHELLLLWEGIVIKTQEHGKITIRAALYSVYQAIFQPLGNYVDSLAMLQLLVALSASKNFPL